MRPPSRPLWPKKLSLLPWHPRAASPNFVPHRIATTFALNAAPVDLPKLVITPGSAQHNSLPSFLDYAKRTNLRPETTHYVGTHYEYTTALALLRLGFSLLRIGRKNDAGIDLIGHWVLAPLREPLRVIIQCKARKISINPSHIREMEGSFQGMPADWRNKDVLGLLITTKKATKGMLEALGQSRWPMGFVLVSREGCVEQFVWNRAASDRGLEGVGVTVRHTPRIFLAQAEEEETEQGKALEKPKKRRVKFKTTGTWRDIQLTWMGSPIFPDREHHDQETVKLMRHIVPGNSISPAAYKFKDVKITPGRPRVSDKAPYPRGGVVGGKMGRSRKASTTVDPTTIVPTDQVPMKRSRPASTTKLQPKKVPSTRGAQVSDKLSTKVATRGRPKGSKNKPKIPVDAG